jgi:Uma2 family endonuclease
MEDVVRLHDTEKRLFELVDGVLVEKPMGFTESRIAALLIQVLGTFAEQQGIGIVTGEAGMMQLARGLVRIPDVSVVLWSRLPNRRLPTQPVPDLSPDLAVEVLSKSNTKAEMDRKIGEYFTAGSLAVWLVDPAARTVIAYSSLDDHQVLSGSAILRAETVLPGFQITIDEIFLRAGLS